ncbi:MAG: four helix bundle protein [Acidobacteriaceae bacterium]
MKDFRTLTVWEKSHALTLIAYKVTQGFPTDERFGLTSQIRRSSASIATNIAEGCGRQGNAEFKRFLQLAMGSATELDYQFLLSRDLGYLTSPSHTEIEMRVLEVKRMLSTLIRKVHTER